MNWKVLQESQWVVQESEQESSNGKSVGLQESGHASSTRHSVSCTGKWTEKFYKKVCGLYRKVEKKISQESQ